MWKHLANAQAKEDKVTRKSPQPVGPVATGPSSNTRSASHSTKPDHLGGHRHLRPATRLGLKPEQPQRWSEGGPDREGQSNSRSGLADTALRLLVSVSASSGIGFLGYHLCLARGFSPDSAVGASLLAATVAGGVAAWATWKDRGEHDSEDTFSSGRLHGDSTDASQTARTPSSIHSAPTVRSLDKQNQVNEQGGRTPTRDDKPTGMTRVTEALRTAAPYLVISALVIRMAILGYDPVRAAIVGLTASAAVALAKRMT